MIKNLIYLGVEELNHPNINQKVIATNFIALLYFTLAIPFSIFTYISFEPLIVFPFSFQGIAIVVFILNKYCFYQLSRFCVCIILDIIFVVYFAYLQPDNQPLLGSLYSIQMAFMIIPWLLFDLDEKLQLYSYVFFYVVVTLSLPYINDLFTLEADIQSLEDGGLSFVCYFTSMSIVSGAVFFFQSQKYTSNKENEKLMQSLSSRNQEIELQNEEVRQQQEEMAAQHDFIEQKNSELAISNEKMRVNEDILKKAYQKLKEKEEEIKLQKQDLEESQAEIMTQNEELMQSQEELTAQRDFIEKQNSDLSSSNEKMRINEDILKKAYQKLKEKEEEIKLQKQDLEESQAEIMTQNEELMQSQEELTAQRDFIEQQNSELATSNQRMKANEDILKKAYQKLKEKEEEIRKTNQELEEREKQISSSIKSALTIQQAILPYPEKLKMLLKDYFVIYMPKDVVSGDFYWLNEVDNKILLASVDCTGHGVPGAFMSLIGNTLLDKIIRVWKITDPAEILTRLHEEVQIVLRQTETGNNNGMDLSILSLEKLNENEFRVIHSGAKSNIYFSRSGQIPVEVMKGQRKSIGGQQNDQTFFENQEVILQKNSLIYLGTDGFADQNDVKRKRFGEKKLISILENNLKAQMDDQQWALLSELNKHMEQSTQRDDIFVIGLKL